MSFATLVPLLCVSRQIHQGWADLFYLILPAKNILLCSACRSPKTSKLGLKHTAIVRDTPVTTARMPLAVRRWPALSATCLGRFPPCFGLTFVFHTSERGTQTHPNTQPSIQVRVGGFCSPRDSRNLW